MNENSPIEGKQVEDGKKEEIQRGQARAEHILEKVQIRENQIEKSLINKTNCRRRISIKPINELLLTSIKNNSFPTNAKYVDIENVPFIIINEKDFFQRGIDEYILTPKTIKRKGKKKTITVH